jgi:hypothetical protein
LHVVADEALPAPRLSLEVRDDHGILLASSTQETAELGWERRPGAKTIRFELDRLPLADGRFHLRVALGEHHLLDDVAQFVVVPPGDERGVLLFEGRWSVEEIAAPVEVSNP